MGQGQDKIARSLTDLQPTAIVELFQLYFNTVDEPQKFLPFHGGALFDKPIKWQGIEYSSLPVESEGFEVNASNQMPRPKIRISNKDYQITQALLANKDFQFGKLIRKRTFVKYLDDYNFDGGNPWGQADASAELGLDTFVISQKTAENKLFVEFELSSPLDLENFEVNNRLIIARYCSWYYRGNGCNYEGIPIATEYNKNIELNEQSINNWSKINDTNEWTTGVYYESGIPVFEKNEKIIINPRPESQSQIPRPAKIWYVCQTGHLSTPYNRPSDKETYWIKDGCNKKLDGCKSRFEKGNLISFSTRDKNITNSYVDLSHKSINNSTNIAVEASVTGSSLSAGSSFSNAINNITGSSVNNKDLSVSWVSAEKKPSFRLKWDRPRAINRIDLYDRSSPNDFGNASIRLLSGNVQQRSGNMTLFPDGSRTTTGFSTVYADELIISGLTNGDPNVGLGEVCVFEPSGLGLYNTDFLSSGITTKKDLHIASWFGSPNGLNSNNQLLNIFHNVATNCPHSGLNLYASGDNLVLNFATRQYSGATPTYSNKNVSIFMPWDFRSVQPFHLEISNGQTSGTGVTSFPEGYIRMYDSNKSSFAEYILMERNTQNKFSGEFFIFRNPSYTGSTTNLKFGINDWQFSSGNQFTPNPADSRVYSNVKLTSNIKFGATAIWTGLSGIDSRIEFFNRQNDLTLESYSVPRLYSEISGTNSPELNSGLFAWWDMDISDTSPYSVSASNNQNLKIYLSGEYTGSIDSSETNLITSSETKNPSSSLFGLPFGGFPGTDRYGR